MIVGTLLASGLSMICILSLCLGDPKRMRTRGLTGRDASVRKRSILTLIAILPGIVMALIGNAPAFLVWLGACAITGWFITLWASLTRPGIGPHGRDQ